MEPLHAALASPPPGAEGILRLALGRALLEAGRPSEALAPLGLAASLEPGGSPPVARWLEAEALLAAGRIAPAIERFESLVAEGRGDAATRRGRFLLAGADRLAGRDDQALAIYRSLAIEEAEQPEGSLSAETLEAWAATGTALALLSNEDRLRRFERLLQRGRAAEALDEAERLAGPTPAGGADPSVLLQALALAGQGRLAEAAELARPLAEAGEPELRRGAAWILARTAARAGRIEEATARYAAVAGSEASIPGLGDPRSRELSDEAAYLAAWLWYDGGQFHRATQRLDAFARARPASPRLDDARWFAAWSAYRAGDRGGALARLARLETGPLADAALYWGGRLGGGSALARERLRRAARIGGEGWYGWLARRRLERLGASPPLVPAVEPREAAPVDGAALQRLRAASALFGLGHRDGAVLALTALAHRAAPRATALEVCRLASFAGEPALALRVARDLLGQTRATERWLHPLAFDDLLAPAARGAGFDEPLLLALVRRESGFRPRAVSSAGAIGLGQLLPRTASRLGQLAALAHDPAGRLADPATNLSLSALYLGLLLDRFGSDAGAVAAYNAGPAPPAAWATQRAGQPLDEWVENVPYKETRVYLKNVLAAREVYRRLTGGPPQLDPAAPVPAPGAGVAF